MKAMFRTVFATLLLAGAALAPALAQDAASVGTLTVTKAPVMISNGTSEFTAASGSVSVHVGDRIMISDEGKANLTYNNGYVLHYVEPGVYEVQVAPATANAGTAGAGASTATTVGVILGAAALAAGSLDQMDNVVPVDPLSH